MATDLVSASEDNESPQYLHVLDLPRLYQRPSSAILEAVLQHFTLPPPSWDAPTSTASAPEGFEKWLISVISSPLSWMTDEEAELIRDSASERIAERCGRTARGDVKRTFKIPLPSRPSVLGSASSRLLEKLGESGSVTSSGASTPALVSGLSTPSASSGTSTPAATEQDFIEITLHEPALTSDTLGHKTWASSYLLSKRLHLLPPPSSRILELGSGTGLVGLSAAAVWGVPVLLTDLPEIISNLQRNIDSNLHLGIDCESQVLDWCDETEASEEEKYETILAADVVYEGSHPGLVAGVVGRWLAKGGRFVVEVPDRAGFEGEQKRFRECMEERGFRCQEEGREKGWDDWGSGGEAGQVGAWWSVWVWV
ncbi:putative methyltransferase-domain-containing protein [Pyronema domesticum]|uniref:Similar to Uncharacterized protein YBR271W acc. no. P38347 n=1 Tax=Pyronema omphalodes (strain CBS 100304) TaxID=1076935 RepID=U4L9A7_PYROM|nr:putative methyltransferase-domain-containing protein [Pyronema domesticum]CCX06769.1 Similar to Uncharacterized protein YBR271W; acc. no. P38347 [Pyronema omphalodes CBS 100304]